MGMGQKVILSSDIQLNLRRCSTTIYLYSPISFDFLFIDLNKVNKILKYVVPQIQLLQEY